MEIIKEELYKWYPIVDEGEYWTDFDIDIYNEDVPKIRTIITNGNLMYTHDECSYGWSTMAKQGNWKYMRIKID